MRKKVTAQVIIKELADFPKIYRLDLRAYLTRKQPSPFFNGKTIADAEWHSYNKSHLEGLASRMALMTRQDMKELLLQIGSIDVCHTGPDYLLSKPIFDITETR